MIGVQTPFTLLFATRYRAVKNESTDVPFRATLLLNFFPPSGPLLPSRISVQMDKFLSFRDRVNERHHFEFPFSSISRPFPSCGCNRLPDPFSFFRCSGRDDGHFVSFPQILPVGPLILVSYPSTLQFFSRRHRVLGFIFFFFFFFFLLFFGCLFFPLVTLPSDFPFPQYLLRGPALPLSELRTKNWEWRRFVPTSDSF